MATSPTPTGSFHGRSRAEPALRHNRASSPPLEKDEKEFTQTARGMQKRQMSADVTMLCVPSELEEHSARVLETDASLFCEPRGLTVTNSSVFVTSPAMKPILQLSTLKRGLEETGELWSRIDGAMDWDMRSPEHIELDELDDMLDDF